jgi:HSP20 family protein
MFENDEDRKKRRDPFDFFNMDNEFNRMFKEMEKIMNAIIRDFSKDRMNPRKSFIHGFKINFGSDGKPNFQEFGHRTLKSSDGERKISDDREPLTELIEGNDDVSITVEIPGVEKEDIDLNVNVNSLEITVDNAERKYHKILNFSCDVIPKTTRATYKNGVLDVVIKRKDLKKKDEGFRVDIQ